VERHLFDVLRFFDVLLDPTEFRLLDWVFTAIVAVSLASWRAAPVPRSWRW
jgi:hypothetical protein